MARRNSYALWHFSHPSHLHMLKPMMRRAERNQILECVRSSFTHRLDMMNLDPTRLVAP